MVLIHQILLLIYGDTVASVSPRSGSAARKYLKVCGVWTLNKSRQSHETISWDVTYSVEIQVEEQEHQMLDHVLEGGMAVFQLIKHSGPRAWHECSVSTLELCFEIT